MGQPPDARLTPQITRQICERTASAAVLEGSIAKIAYQDFLTLWRDADPDIPVLQQAKAEYTKLN